MKFDFSKSLIEQCPVFLIATDCSVFQHLVGDGDCCCSHAPGESSTR